MFAQNSTMPEAGALRRKPKTRLTLRYLVTIWRYRHLGKQRVKQRKWQVHSDGVGETDCKECKFLEPFLFLKKITFACSCHHLFAILTAPWSSFEEPKVRGYRNKSPWAQCGQLREGVGQMLVGEDKKPRCPNSFCHTSSSKVCLTLPARFWTWQTLELPWLQKTVSFRKVDRRKFSSQLNSWKMP